MSSVTASESARDKSDSYKPLNKATAEPRGSNRSYLRDFSPSARKSGESILRDLKNNIHRGSDMFFSAPTDWNNGKMSQKAEESGDWPRRGMDDMRSRHPMFRMPNWFSEDDDVSNLTSRMSQAPNWPPFRRQGGPWRERRNSGGSAMSGGTTSEDDVDSHMLGGGHTIPIRIEAEAPPGYEPVKPAEPPANVPAQPPANVPAPQTTVNDGFHPQMRVGNQPPYASKTTSAVDTCKEELPRDTRSSSAPPEMDNMENVSKNGSDVKPPLFNNVAKPFGAAKTHEKPSPIQEEVSPNPINVPESVSVEQPMNSPQYPQQQAPPPNRGQKTSVIRNIPIVFEGRDGAANDEPRSPRSKPATPPQPQPHSQRQQHFNNVPQEFAQEPMFNDPFFEFGRGPQHMARHPHMSGSPKQHQFYQQHPAQQFQQHQPQPSAAPTPPPPPKAPQQPPPPPERKSQPSPPKAKEPPKDKQMAIIISVRALLTDYQKEVEAFTGSEKNKEYRYLDEMLTRTLLELDNIDPDGRDEVRQCRRKLVKDINATIALLEQRVCTPKTQPEAPAEPMIVDEKQEPKPLPNETCPPETPTAEPSQTVEGGPCVADVKSPEEAQKREMEGDQPKGVTEASQPEQIPPVENENNDETLQKKAKTSNKST